MFMVERMELGVNEALVLPEQPWRHTEVFKASLEQAGQTLVLLKDVTHIKEKEMVRWQQKMQTILLSSVTHDLKTPLNSAIAVN
mmetsp:Transcript_31543/g.23396  ORF Transcript_31543/g.23396 Transcript_31543/m.23396 type:complete len:84 (+) Transcript_31543:660-911(+)